VYLDSSVHGQHCGLLFLISGEYKHSNSNNMQWCEVLGVLDTVLQTAQLSFESRYQCPSMLRSANGTGLMSNHVHMDSSICYSITTYHLSKL
jgi:hypothetical protein